MANKVGQKGHALKIGHHFKLAPERADELTRLQEFYTNAQRLDEFLISSKTTKTDIIETLIAREFKRLVEDGFEV
jgi:hypothetical protein